MSRYFEQTAPEALLGLAQCVEGELAKRQIADAKQIGIDAAVAVARAWGGSMVYIPRNLAMLATERDAQIYREFKGDNHAALARKYGVSVQWIYQIVKKMRAAESKRLQKDMFSDGGAKP